ncbi:MAG: hypothetical protein KAZ88_10630 [Acidimicrobiia bacterium]|nr:hypothetical protein [Acidimicrobiia bacterium]MBP8181435.1 hypothetical protein [Acidimicrobiia bacterium]
MLLWLLLLLGLTLSVALIVPLVISRLRPPSAPLHAEVQSHEKRARQLLIGGTLAAIPLCLALFWTNPLERGAYRAAPLFGVLILLAVCAGEVLAAPPKTTLRSAGIASRRAVDLVPRRLTWAVSITAVALLISTIAGALTGSDGPLGKSDTYTAVCEAMSATAGPYPGRLSAIPILVLALIGGLAAAFALRTIANRRGLGDNSADDLVARRRSARAVVSGTGIAMAIPLMGVSITGGLALLGSDAGYLVTDGEVIRCDSALREWTGSMWITLGLLAFPVLVWSVGSLVAAAQPAVSHRKRSEPEPLSGSTPDVCRAAPAAQ